MMKHYLMLLAVFGVLGAGRAPATELRLLTENVVPVNYIENGEWKGSTAEIVKEIARRLGIAAPIESVPWARGYKMALSQPNVALFSMARTPDREAQFHWVGPVGLFRSAFYAPRGTRLVIDSLDQARNVQSIGTYKDDVRETYLLKLGFTNLDSTNSNESNLRKLLNDRIDLWATSTMEAFSVPRQMGLDASLIEHVYTFQEFEMYIAMSKGTPRHTVDRWQAALDGMKADGAFMTIWQSWLPHETLPEAVRRPSPAWQAGHRLSIYTENSPPGNYVAEGRLQGPAVRVVQEIMHRLGTPSAIEVVPWARGYHLARTQPNVALFATSRLPQRETLFKWVGPLYTQRWGFYARHPSKIAVVSLEEARRVGRIGTYREDAKEQYLKSIGFQNLVSTNNNIGNVNHLMDGSLDLWVSSDFNMPYYVRYAGYDPDQFHLVLSFKTVGNYIAFSRLTPDHVVARWQKTLDAIRRDGTWARYFTNSGGGDGNASATAGDRR